MVLKCEKCKSLNCDGDHCIENLASEVRHLATNVRRLDVFMDTTKRNSDKALVMAKAALAKHITKPQEVTPETTATIEESKLKEDPLQKVYDEIAIFKPMHQQFIRKVVLEKPSGSLMTTKPTYKIKHVRFSEPLVEPGSEPEKVQDENPTPSGSKETAEQVTPLEPLAKKPGHRVTSNDFLTQSHQPIDSLRVEVQDNERTLIFKPPIKATGRDLHQRVKEKLGMRPDERLNLVIMNHIVVQNDDKTLWNYGIRNFPTVISTVPEDTSRGDRLNLTYEGKGTNVNGSYVAFPKRMQNDQRSQSQ